MARSHAMLANHPTDRILGNAPAIQALRAQIRHLAAFDTIGSPVVPTLLLHGETGTGKGLVARVIHDSGPRAHSPFIDVNCAAIPETLLEAELFGFEAGTFTDAKRAKPGLFEAATGGTLFLDEINSLPPALQGKFLKAIEEKRVRRLGAVAEHPVDVKLIAATQVELSGQVRGGGFRADLYHRLAVVILQIPPLRERGEDIVTLAQQLLGRYAAAHGLLPKRLSEAAEAWLRGYSWPGNVRELSHLMERVTLLSPDPLLDAHTLERLCLPHSQPGARPEPMPASESHESLDEPARVRRALMRTGGNVVQAARLLGLSRDALRYRMRRYGIERPRLEELAPPPPPMLPKRGPGHFPLPPGEGQGEGSSSSLHDLDPPHPTLSQGERVPSEAFVPAWEQKPVAVLAIDLTLPTVAELTSRYAEPWTVVTRWQQTIMEKARGFGGVLLQRSPSLLIIAFGIPRALEQLAQRAVQTALAIRHLVAEAGSHPGQAPRPDVRMAVHLGEVLVDVQAHDPTERLLAVGETLALPVRLLGHAAPGDILASPQVGRLAEGWFEVQARELWLGAGNQGRIKAHSVVGLRPRRFLPAGPRERAPRGFVGREQELAALRQLLEQVQGGRGQVVGIVGEPGMGKSRLLDEFRQRLMGQQVTYLEGRCLSYGGAIPYLPVLDLLRDYCEIAQTDSPEAITEKVCFGLQAVGMDPAERAPYVLLLFGMPGGTERLAGLSPETLKARTFETLRQLSLYGSRQRPLILAVEDLHWIDKTSEDFFTSLVESLPGAPLLFLSTYRPGYQPPWIKQSYATQIALQPLAPRDSLSVVHSVLQTEQLPEPLAQLILGKAEGNPFFLEEIVQALVDQGVLIRGPAVGPGLKPAPTIKPLTAIQLPPTVQGVLAARIDRLPAEAKALLQTLAVIGKAFSCSLLTQVVEQSQEELQRLLAHLQGAEFIYERPAFPEPEYSFKHALTQEVAYTSLLLERRRRLHERTAQAIEALWGQRLEERYSELAHHYSRSGNTAKALEYLQRAARQAVQRSANVEALSHLTRGLEMLRTLPDGLERAQHELSLQIALGVPLIATSGYAAPEVETAYARARELCGQVGDTPQLYRVLVGLWVFYFVRGAFPTARELGEQLLRLAQGSAEPARLQVAHNALGTTCFYLGELRAARAHLEEGSAVHAPPRSRSVAFRRWQDPGVSCLCVAAWTLWALGYPDQALGRTQEALRLANALAHPFSQAFALFFAAVLHQLRREGPAVHAHATALSALAEEQGFALWAAAGTILQGWWRAAQGERVEGRAQLHQGLADWRGTGAEGLRPYFLSLLAETYGATEVGEEACALLAEALTVAAEHGERWWEAELYRLQGELLLRRREGERGRGGETAEECFQQALEVARRQQAKSLELRAALSLSRQWRGQGKNVGEVRNLPLLAEVYGWFTEGLETADLHEARGLLEASGST